MKEIFFLWLLIAAYPIIKQGLWGKPDNESNPWI